MTDTTVEIHGRLPLEVAEALRRRAHDEGRCSDAVITSALRAYLEAPFAGPPVAVAQLLDRAGAIAMGRMMEALMPAPKAPRHLAIGQPHEHPRDTWYGAIAIIDPTAPQFVNPPTAWRCEHQHTDEEAAMRCAGEAMADPDLWEREDVRRCRVCGCTDARACLGGCWWAGDDICSSCAGSDLHLAKR